MAKSTTDIKQKFKTPNGLQIHVQCGDVTKATADAIVVPEGNAFKKLGMVGEALAKVEPKFKEKRDIRIRKLDPDNTLWEAFVSKLGKPFKYVLHAVLSPVDRCKPVEQWKQSMDLLYNNILKTAEREKIACLALPLLGSGNGRATAEDAIDVALDAILPFKAKRLKWIIIVSQERGIVDEIVSQFEMRLFSETPEGQPETRSCPAAKPMGKREARTESVGKTNLSVCGTSVSSSPMKSPAHVQSSSLVTPKDESQPNRSNRSSKSTKQRKSTLLADDGKPINPENKKQSRVSQIKTNEQSSEFSKPPGAVGGETYHQTEEKDDTKLENNSQQGNSNQNKTNGNSGNNKKASDIQPNLEKQTQSKIQKSINDIGTETDSGDDASSDGGATGTNLTPVQRSQKLQDATNLEASKSPDGKETKALDTDMPINVDVDIKREGRTKNSAKRRAQGMNDLNSNKHVTTVLVGNTSKDPSFKSAKPNGEKHKEVGNYRDQDKYESKVQNKNVHKSLQASRFETNDQQVDLGKTEEYTNGSKACRKDVNGSKVESQDTDENKADLKNQQGSKAGSKAGPKDQQGSKAKPKLQDGYTAAIDMNEPNAPNVHDRSPTSQTESCTSMKQSGSRNSHNSQKGAPAPTQDVANIQDQNVSIAEPKEMSMDQTNKEVRSDNNGEQHGKHKPEQDREQDVVDYEQHDKIGAIPKKPTGDDKNDRKDNKGRFENKGKEERTGSLQNAPQEQGKKKSLLKRLFSKNEKKDKQDNLEKSKTNVGSLVQTNVQFGQDNSNEITETKVLERSQKQNQRERPDPKTETPRSDASKDNNDVTGEDQQCPICMGTIDDPKKLDKCGHVFCRDCIDASFKQFKPVCPNCNMVYGEITGIQPDGNFQINYSGDSLPGYEQHGTIEIIYFFPDGVQGPNHPSPGMSYKGTTRWAYLPNSKEGKDVLELLKTAFERKLTFTIGRSTTTGKENVVTWNDIHHKTNKFGGPTKYGYPDDTYLDRVRDELKSKGVV